MGCQSFWLVIFLCCHISLVNRAQCTGYPSKEGDFGIKTVQYEDILRGETVRSPRITNMDLLKNIQVLEATEVANRAHTYLAVARTKGGSAKYSGGGGDLKLDNPTAIVKQYSASRIRINAGYDSIEAGWRVDPNLYGDSQTRLFVRTDGARTHCFNTQCPGFIITMPGFNFDNPIREVSKPGGLVVAIRTLIVRDNANGNWVLKLTTNKTEVGYWPRHLFNGLAGLASLIEWGGVVYSPPGSPLPPMGSGTYPRGDPRWDGTVSEIKVLNEHGQESDAPNVDLDANFKLYSVVDAGVLSGDFGRTILYGGPGHS